MREKFKKGDYIINRSCGDMAVYDKTDKKGYMHFKYYYSAMFHELADCDKYVMQINYQKFYDNCNEMERKTMDDILTQNKPL